MKPGGIMTDCCWLVFEMCWLDGADCFALTPMRARLSERYEPTITNQSVGIFFGNLLEKLLILVINKN